MESLILIGGGGHCKSVIDVIESEGKFKIVGILDLLPKVGGNVLGYTIIGTDDEIEQFFKLTNNFLITVGHVKSYKTRKFLADKVISTGGTLVSITSPYAHVSKYAQVGNGTVIHHFANINSGAIVGENCIINAYANIEHDVIIGNFSHVSTGAMVNGDCAIGTGVFLGSNCTLRIGATIASDVLIGACSFVNADITESGFYKGIPAKKSMLL